MEGEKEEEKRKSYERDSPVVLGDHHWYDPMSGTYQAPVFISAWRMLGIHSQYRSILSWA